MVEFVSENNKPTYEELQQEVVTLKQLVHRLEKVVIEQNKRIESLELELAKYKKNSSNSSKPPSSDIVKPPKKRKQKGKRKIGAQFFLYYTIFPTCDSGYNAKCKFRIRERHKNRAIHASNAFLYCGMICCGSRCE